MLVDNLSLTVFRSSLSALILGIEGLNTIRDLAKSLSIAVFKGSLIALILDIKGLDLAEIVLCPGKE